MGVLCGPGRRSQLGIRKEFCTRVVQEENRWLDFRPQLSLGVKSVGPGLGQLHLCLGL